MRPGTKLAWGVLAGFAGGIATSITYAKIYASDGFLKNAVDTATMPPITATKILIIVAALLTFLAFPFAIAEWVSERRYTRMARTLREERANDDIREYDGPEGRGLLFAGPAGRLLLLEGSAGLAGPRTIELAPPATDETPIAS